ncbi:hypothetical protein VTJ83DRAFT_1816 [Remersonia thermophila]|uniref:DUF8035 domain-containing protein n=1 Tax=Remersonia thermophila TaxID=72144 RepID=A0ABR4DGZ6_9PEZI
MTDPSRYRYEGRRSPPAYNPARSSMPVTSDAYGSLYAGDLHAMSASHHEGMTRSAEFRAGTVPAAGTTYAARKDEPLSRSTTVTEPARSHHRGLDAHTKRPVVVNLNKHAGLLSPRSGSPTRDPFRSSEEGPYYAEPASSIPRGRPPPLDDEDYRRLRERTHHDRLANRPSAPDSYRPTRAASLYAGPNHRPAHPTFEFSEDAYEYTKPSDLARYDLDHDRRPKARRPSIDRYYRPTVSISTDLTRPFEPPERRAHGPPPTTRGLDKIGWGATAGGIYDGAGARMPVPSALDSGPEPRRLEYEAPGSPRGRPYVEGYYDDDPYYYRDVDEQDVEYYQDDRVPARGFGILVDPNDVENLRDPPEKVYREDRRERRDPKRYEVVESRRRPEDYDLEIVRHEHDDRDRRRRRDRDHDDEPDGRGDKARDKAAASLAVRKKDDRDRDSSPPRRYRDEDPESRRQEDADRSRSRKEPLLGDEEFEIVEHPRDRVKARDEKESSPDATETKEAKDRKETKGDSKALSPRDGSPPSDDARSKDRRRPRDSAFNPNDTAALAEMKARLAELNAKDDSRAPEEPSSSKDKNRPVADKDRPAAGKDESSTKEPSSDRQPSSEKRDPDNKDAPKDDGAPSRDPAAAPAREEKQVRVVPPPKEPEKKPIKGILKQPRAHFPEEPNPVREGVAPHKDDKSKSDVPPGARWTKISRKMVNPEALRIGKERFEVRDDFVIVLRVLSKEEIQEYAAATAQLRERRRRELERAEARAGGNNDADYDKERDREDDGDKKQRHHRQHRRGKDEDERDRREREREDRERERDRHSRRGYRGREEDVEDNVVDVRRAHYRGHRE